MNKTYLINYLLLITLFMVLPGCLPWQKKSEPTISYGKKTNVVETDPAEGLYKPVKNMTFAEAAYAWEYYTKQSDHWQAINVAERLLAVGGDQETTRKITIELAQLLLDDGKYEKAIKYATNYQTLYPGTEEIKLAHFITIKATFLATASADRDQTKTQKTIELAQNFLNKYKTDTQYHPEIREMVDSCYHKLVQSEINVINTYLARYNYQKHEAPLISAYRRLAYLEEKLLPQAPQEAPRIAEAALIVAQAGEKPAVLKWIDEQQQQQALTLSATTA